MDPDKSSQNDSIVCRFRRASGGLFQGHVFDNPKENRQFGEGSPKKLKWFSPKV